MIRRKNRPKSRRSVTPKALQDETLDDDISIHIFSTSATLVGVCLTVIGIFKALFQIQEVDSLGDDLLSFDALLFLGACLLSYIALRTRRSNRRHSIEKAADGLFLVDLLAMAFACGLITYTLI